MMYRAPLVPRANTAAPAHPPLANLAPRARTAVPLAPQRAPCAPSGPILHPSAAIQSATLARWECTPPPLARLYAWTVLLAITVLVATRRSSVVAATIRVLHASLGPTAFWVMYRAPLAPWANTAAPPHPPLAPLAMPERTAATRLPLRAPRAPPGLILLPSAALLRVTLARSGPAAPRAQLRASTALLVLTA